MRTLPRLAAALALAVLAAPLAAHELPAPAADDAKKMAPPAAAESTLVATPTGFRAEFIGLHDHVAKELLDLAEAMPAEKYAWRPGEGVRSYGEVCLHIASADYGLPAAIGIKPPEGIDPRKIESSPSDKAAAIATLKASLDFVRDAVSKMSDADLEKSVSLFGRDMSARAVLMLLANHIHEHLGQSIAYARTNGVVPPWSAKQGG